MVLGSILTELTLARRIADAYTKELFDEYSEDPRLAALSIPRAVLDEVTISLKFQVNEVTSPPIEPIVLNRLEAVWSKVFRESTLPGFLDQFQLSSTQKAQVVLAVTTDLPAREIRQRFRAAERERDRTDVPADQAATAASLEAWQLRFDRATLEAAARGDRTPLVEASAAAVLDAWNRIPADIRALLGNKASFSAQLTRRIDAGLGVVLGQETERAGLVAALQSRIDVLIKGAEIEDVNRIQALTITMRGADVEAILNAQQASSD
jgi:hypothetical protein